MRIKELKYSLEAETAQDGKVQTTAKGKYYDQPELVDIMEQFS